MSRSRRSEGGFSLTELMVVIALLGTVAAIAVPTMRDVSASVKLSEAARLVERELQDARVKAVSTNRPLRVRTNCPAMGFLRTVEVIGTTADTASTRCNPVTYPYPPADTDVITRPNFDGPVRTLPNQATVSDAIIELRPDGTAAQVVSGVVQPIATPVTITITRQTRTRSVTINAAGKIQLQ